MTGAPQRASGARALASILALPDRSRGPNGEVRTESGPLEAANCYAISGHRARFLSLPFSLSLSLALQPCNPMTLNPATLSPNTLNPATLSPNTLNPATLSLNTFNPATPRPSALDPQILIF